METGLRYLCSFCSRSFFDSHTRNRHEETHHADVDENSSAVTFHKCAYCFQVFPNLASKANHEQSHFPSAPLECSLCDEIFFDAAAKRRHDKTYHHDGRQVRTALNCVTRGEWINIQFARECVTDQRVTDFRPVVFQCAYCPRTFARLCLKNSHESLHVAGDWRVFNCSVCPMQFPSAAEKATHEAVHRRRFLMPKREMVDWDFPDTALQPPTTTIARFASQPTATQATTTTIARVFSAAKSLVVKDEPEDAAFGDDPLPPVAPVSKKRRGTSVSSRSALKCHVCNRQFSRPCHLGNHIKTHQQRVQPTLKTEPVVGELLNSMPSMMEETQPKSGRHRQTFMNAMTKFRERRAYKCSRCERVFETESSRSRHEQVHNEKKACPRVPVSPKKDFPCPGCNKRFKEVANLLRHNRFCPGRDKAKKMNVSGDKAKEMSVSGDTAKKMDVSGDTANEMSVSGDGREEKEVAMAEQRGSKQKEEVSKGNRQGQEKGDGRTCSICHRQFLSHAAMLTHRFYHSEQEVAVCPVCNKRFASHSAMLKHKFYHRVEPRPASRDRQCRVCSKSFSSHQAMLEHSLAAHKAQDPKLAEVRKMDGGKKRFKCNFCPRLFAMKCHQVSHEVCHSGVREIACSFCPRLFTHRRYKWIHETKTHKNELAAGRLEQEKAGENENNGKKKRRRRRRRRPRKETIEELKIEEEEEKMEEAEPEVQQTPVEEEKTDEYIVEKPHVSPEEMEVPEWEENVAEPEVEETPLESQETAKGAEVKKKGHFKCSFCPRRFSRACHVANHEISHSRDQTFKCKLCPKVFARDRFLHMHEKAKHLEAYVERKNKSRRRKRCLPPLCFCCAFCSHKFMTMQAKNEHEDSHLKPKTVEEESVVGVGEVV